MFKHIFGESVSIAVGKESGKWYVQTTDKREDTHFSEPIEEGLDTKAEAMAIAKHYAKKYGSDVQVWDLDDTLTQKQVDKHLSTLVINSWLDKTLQDAISKMGELAGLEVSMKSYSHIVVIRQHIMNNLADNFYVKRRLE